MKMVPGRHYFGHYEPHWACKKCIVKVMCTDDGCYMTSYINEICLNCNKRKKCKIPSYNERGCKKIDRLRMFENIDRIMRRDGYDQVIIKHLEETSIFRLMKQTKSEWNNYEN